MSEHRSGAIFRRPGIMRRRYGKGLGYSYLDRKPKMGYLLRKYMAGRVVIRRKQRPRRFRRLDHRYSAYRWYRRDAYRQEGV